MTNEAISAILEHLCNQARDSAHATFGLMEMLRDLLPDSTRLSTLTVGTSSADQLLRSIDDVRELLSTAPPSNSVALEEFDLALCAREIIEVLNLVSGIQTGRMVLDAPAHPYWVIQDRKTVEQIFTRVLDTAFKLSPTSELHVTAGPAYPEGAVRLAVSGLDAGVAARLTKWLKANPDDTDLRAPGDVPFGIAVMVAGKNLRDLDGSAEWLRNSDGRSTVFVNLPSHGTSQHADRPSRQEAPADILSILVTEDCDDSFALSELVLQNENVWRARNGEEAFDMVQKQRFDVVFMDVHMPGMDGYTAIRRIREWETQTGNAHTPLVLLSSDDLETQRRSAAQSGCSGFLRKPLRRNDLTHLLGPLRAIRTLA